MAVRKKTKQIGQPRKRRKALAPAKARDAGLKQQLAESRAQQAATAEILKVIASSPAEVQPVFDAIVKSCSELFRGSGVTLRTVQGDRLEVRADIGYDSGSVPIDRQSAVGVCVLEARAIHLPDLEEATAVFPRIREMGLRGGYRSGIYTPLLRGIAAIGSISVLRRAAGAFSDKEMSLLQTFADQAVIAIENVRLFNETKEALERQTATAEILRVISRSVEDTNPVFESIVDACVHLFPDHQAGINLVGADGRVYLQACRSPHREALKEYFRRGPERKKGTSFLLKRRVAHFPDVQSDPDVPNEVREGCIVTGARAFIYAPMASADRGIGTIWVGRERPGPFSDKEIALLQTFADQAVIAIQNARLFNETKEALERQTATAEILKVIASSPSDVQPVFDAIAQSALRLIGGVGATVTRIVGDELHLAALTSTTESGNDAVRGAFPQPILTGVGMNARTIRERKSLFIGDIETDSDSTAYYREIGRARGFRAVVGTPMMMRDGEPIGAISVTRGEPGPFSEHEVKLLQTFADQAVIAIENVRLFNETKEALERQTATGEILKVMSGSPTNVQPVFDAIVESGGRLFADAAVTIVLVEGDQHHAVAMSEKDPERRARWLARMPRPNTREYMHAVAILDRKLIDEPDVKLALGRFPAGAKNFLASGYRAITIAPMMREGSAIGAISVVRMKPGALGEKQIALLQTFADQAVIAIENVRLFNETKEALERQTATAEILKVIASSPSDVQPVFDAIAASARRLISGRYAVVATRVADSLHLAALTGTTEEGDAALRKLFPTPITGQGAMGKAVIRRTPVSVEDIETDPAYSEAFRQGARTRGMRSMLCVPMLRETEAIGVITVNRAECGPFTEHQVNLLKAFADQAVIAIENVRLFNETKEALERQTATAEILKVISGSPTDVQPVFEAILRSAVSLCGAEIAAVFPYDGKLVHLGATHNWSPEAVRYFSGVYPSPPSSTLMSGRTILAKSIVKLADAAADAHYDPNSAVTGQWRRMLGVPMLREGEPLGALIVCWRDPGDTPQRQIDLLQTFADQAAIAIENVRLFRELEARNRDVTEALEQQTATAEILRVISSSPTNVQPVFDAIVQSGLKIFAGTSIGISIADGDSQLVVASGGNATQIPLGIRVPRSRESATGMAVVERIVVNIRDTEAPDAPPSARDNGRALGFRAVAAVPLLREGEAIGAISLLQKDPGGLSDKQVTLLRSFADQAVIAIENVRLFNETKEALERQTATAEILKVIASSPSDVQPVFDAIVETAKRLIGAFSATVTRLADGKLHLAAHTATTLESEDALKRYFPIPVEGTLMGRAVQLRRPEFVDDFEADTADARAGRDLARVRGFRSVVFVPLVRGDAAIGALNVTRREAGRLSDHHVELLKTFADQAVIAIENVRLFNETKEALERQTATSEILRVISSSPTDLKPVFDAILENALRLCEAHLGILNLREADTFRTVAQCGANPEGAKWLSERGAFKPEYTLQRMIAERQPVQIPDLKAIPAYSEGRPITVGMVEKLKARTFLVVPLIMKGEVIGNVAVYRPEVRLFSDKQIALVRTFADQAVIAIENVRLFNETKESLERQTATAEILKVIASSPSDVQPVFDAIAAAAGRLFGGQGIGVWLVEGQNLRLVAINRGDALPDTPLRDRVIKIDRTSAVGSAVLDSKVYQIRDMLELPDDNRMGRRLAAEYGFRSTTGVPMLREGKTVGVLALVRAEPGVLSEGEIALLQTFADQAVIAIENVRLFNETKEALERQTATAEILRVISSSPSDLRPVFDVILTKATQLCGAHLGLLGMFEGEKYRTVASLGATPQHRKNFESRGWYVPPPATSLARSTAARKPIQTLDLRESQGYRDGAVQTVDLVELAGARSYLQVPMLKEGEVIGSIGIFRGEVRPFTDAQIDMVSSFASQAVIAIENVRLFNETKEALDRQTATGEILASISGSMTDTQPVFDAIVRNLLRLFGTGYAVVALIRNGVFELAGFRGEPGFEKLAEAYPLPVDRQTIIGEVVVSGEAVQYAPIVGNPAVPPTSQALARKFGFDASMTAPMLREGKAIGAILTARREPVPFDEKQIALLKSFADQAVIAIENVRLFNETKEALERLTATSEVLKVISSSPTDTQPVFDSIAERAATLCGAQFCSLSSFDGETIHMAAVYGATPEGAEAIRAAYPMKPGSATLAARVIRDRKPLHIADVQADPEYEGKEAASAVGFRSVLGVPMMREGHLAGAIVIGREQAGLFPDNQVNLLTTFADQAVIAIENVRLFHEIEEKGRQLEVASQHKSNFLASMSHELRTPLNAILGFNEMILGQVYGEVPADMQEPLADIQTSGKHLLRLINNVLDLAKIEAGRMELSLQDYSVHDTVASVHSTLRPLAAEKGLEFLANVPNDVPLAYGDGGRMTQCLMNLAGNSLKFTKVGKVEISVKTSGELLVYKVTDTGIGIPPDKIGSLFTEFKQTDATIANEYGGTGLGLSISRKFVEMHGGRIWVESELGKGSAFIIEVPLRVANK